MRNQHPKLRPPIPNMILPDDPMPLELHHPANRIADDGASQVADVHFLGDVWAGVVDDDGLRILRRLDAEPRIVFNRGELLREPFRREADVDEPGTGDRWFFRRDVA